MTVSLAGSVFASVSLHAARHRTALGLVCTVLPFIIVGPFIGPVIDRLRGGRRFMVFLSAIGRAGACLLMALWIHRLWLFPAAFLSLVCSKTYLVAKASLVPSVVTSHDDLVQANAKLAVGSSVVTSIAAIGGAGLYRAFGSGTVLHVDTVLLLICAWRALGLPAPTATRPSDGVDDTGGWRPAIDPAFPIAGIPLAALLMAAMRGMAGLMVALVIFAFRHENAPLIWYGFVGVASVSGNLGGAAIAPWIRAHAREHQIMVTCAVVIGMTALFATQVQVLKFRPAAIILGFTVGVCSSVAKLAFDALVQRAAPSAARSRLFAHYEGLFQLSWVMAALLPTLVAMSLLAGFLVVAGVTLVSATVFAWGVSRVRRGSLPPWWPGAGRAQALTALCHAEALVNRARRPASEFGPPGLGGPVAAPGFVVPPSSVASGPAASGPAAGAVGSPSGAVGSPSSGVGPGAAPGVSVDRGRNAWPPSAGRP